MQTFPLYARSVEEAISFQFKVIEAARTRLIGEDVLSLGDLGVPLGTGRPCRTEAVERVYAAAFDAEDAVFVRGAGTGALRWALNAALPVGGRVLVHDAPIYPTTEVTLESMGAKPIFADFNSDDALKEACESHRGEIDCVLVQVARQKPSDSYEAAHVIELIRSLAPGVSIVADDNYTVGKVRGIGCEIGADLSTFSCFKLLGPEGVGVVVGPSELVGRIRSKQYSGGSQVQGHEAMEALRGMVYAPVAHAITAKVCAEVAGRLNEGEVPGVARAYVVNAESRVVIVEFDDDIAGKVLETAPKIGAATHPVGCESRYEFLPMFYRISGTFRAADPTWERRMIRINVMRAGADTVIDMLSEALGLVRANSAAPKE